MSVGELEQRKQVPELRLWLRTVECAASEVQGCHTEVPQTTVEAQAAEHGAAALGQHMHGFARSEAVTARLLREEMTIIQTVTNLLLSELQEQEQRSETSTAERAVVVSQRASPEAEAHTHAGACLHRGAALDTERQSLEFREQKYCP